jgi:hypothetical protein
MLNNLNKGQKMTAEKTLKTQIEKTVKTMKKQLKQSQNILNILKIKIALILEYLKLF